MKRRYDMEYGEKENFSPWETYSDLYCGLLMVFVLLFFFAIYQYIDARERNNANTLDLQEAMKAEQASVLAIYKADLEDQEKAYQEKEIQLENQRTALAIMQADLDGRTELLTKQEEVISDQKKQLQAQQVLLDSQAEQIEQIVGVRGQLINRLNSELAKNQIQISADQTTGAIAFESAILFAKNSNELSEDGKEFFEKFIPVYLEVLLQPEFQGYIAEIMIEGHTDDTGSYMHNLELSQKRAWSVAEYILNDDCDFLSADTITAFKSLITVNGCADKAPIFRDDGTIDADKSRRVEIKFRLKDQEMIQKMDEILNN